MTRDCPRYPHLAYLAPSFISRRVRVQFEVDEVGAMGIEGMREQEVSTL